MNSDKLLELSKNGCFDPQMENFFIEYMQHTFFKYTPQNKDGIFFFSFYNSTFIFQTCAFVIFNYMGGPAWAENK